MAQKLKVETWPDEVQDFLNALIRANKLTLRGMQAALAVKYGAEAEISANGIHNYRKSINKSIERIRATQDAARAMVGELGYATEGETGRSLVLLCQSMLHRAAMAADGNEALKISEIKQFAQTLKLMLEAGHIGIRTQERIELAAREKYKAELLEKVDEETKRGGATIETRRALYKMVGVNL